MDLLLALGIGVVLALRPAEVPIGLRPTYLHLFIVGWISQLIFGVSHWMFPRASKEDPRGTEWLGWVAFWCLNAGLLLRVITEPFAHDGAGGIFLVVSGGLQLAAGIAYATHIWPRIKER
jgi:hypothetical protein